MSDFYVRLINLQLFYCKEALSLIGLLMCFFLPTTTLFFIAPHTNYEKSISLTSVCMFVYVCLFLINNVYTVDPWFVI